MLKGVDGQRPARIEAPLCAGVQRLDDAALLRWLDRRGAARGARPVPPATAQQLAQADAAVAGRFTLVGETHALGERFDWMRNPSRDREWLIGLHKFGFAIDLAQAWRATGRARYLRRWAQLLAHWLDTMGSGALAFSDAQVEAKRVEHWIVSFELLRGTGWTALVPGGLARRLVARIGEEARYIGAHLRPARNHRTFQLYAMFLAGVTFAELRGAQRLVDTAVAALTRNLLDDFGADGVHVELSTHYHQITLETAVAFVERARAAGIALAPRLLQRLRRALEFSLYMTWPDGEIPLINDSDNGDHRALLHAGARLFRDPRLLWGATGGRDGQPASRPGRHFEHCGYVVLSDGWGRDAQSYRTRQHVFYDCASLGLGSHSHYDLFSFCYHVGGRQLVVDPGRYTYCADPDEAGIDWRRAFKRTASHNTVTIDGLDQTRYLSKSACPPPGVERLDRARYPAKHGPDVELLDADRWLGARSDWVAGTARSHEYAPQHTRLLVYLLRQYLFVLDIVRIDDGAEHDCALHFHLAADWLGAATAQRQDGQYVVRGAGWQLRALAGPDVSAELTRGWVSKQYGVRRPAPVVRLARRAGRTVAFASVVAPDAPQGLRIERLARVQAGQAGAAGALCFRVEGRLDGQPFADTFVHLPDGAEHRDGALRVQARLAAYRRDARGRLAHLVAARPGRLELDGAAAAADAATGHVEWSATEPGVQAREQASAGSADWGRAAHAAHPSEQAPARARARAPARPLAPARACSPTRERRDA